MMPDLRLIRRSTKQLKKLADSHTGTAHPGFYATRADVEMNAGIGKLEIKPINGNHREQRIK